jgi:O-antigen/teichoic acid export membrane protein
LDDSTTTTRDSTTASTLERRVIAGTGLQLAAHVVTAALSFLAARELGLHWTGDDASLGEFNLHQTLFLIAGVFVDFGTLQIAVRESVRHPEQEAQTLRVLFRLRLRIVAIVWLAYVAVAVGNALWTGVGLRSAALPIVAALHLFAAAPNSAGAWLQARVRFGAIAASPIAGYGFFFASIVALHHARVGDPGWYVLALGVGLAIQSLVPWLAARRRVAFLGPVEPGRVRELFRSALPIGLSAAVSTIYFRMDALLLQWLLMPEASGRYYRTFQLLSFSIKLPSQLCDALFPALTRAATRGGDRLVTLVRRVAAVLGGFALPFTALGLSWGAQALWILWTRRHDAVPFDAFVATNREIVRCVPPLAVAATAIYLAYPQMTALTALGLQRVNARVTLTALCVKVVVSSGAILWLGVPGAALATMVVELGVVTWVSLALRAATGRFALARPMLRPLVVAAVVAAVAASFPSLAPWRAAAASVALALVAFVAGGALPLKLGVQE